jgi:Lon protease-like protein
VLFPSACLPLRIFEPRYVDLIGTCMRDASTFGIVGISQGVEAGGPAETHNLGTHARIVDFDQGADGLLNIVVQGGSRFELHSSHSQENGLLIGNVVNLPDLRSENVPQEYSELVDLLAEIDAKSPLLKPANGEPANSSDLAYGLAQILPIAISTKIELLALNDPLILLRRLSVELDQLRRSSQ